MCYHLEWKTRKCCEFTSTCFKEHSSFDHCPLCVSNEMQTTIFVAIWQQSKRLLFPLSNSFFIVSQKCAVRWNVKKDVTFNKKGLYTECAHTNQNGNTQKACKNYVLCSLTRLKSFNWIVGALLLTYLAI